MRGSKEYLENLRIILSMIDSNQLTFDDLAQQVAERFGAKITWVRESLRICIIYTSLAKLKGDLLELTEDGRKYLETGDVTSLAKCFYENIWGFREILLWLKEKPHEVWDLYAKLKQIGATWEHDYQVRHRIEWLKAFGFVEERNRKIYLTQDGLQFIKTLEPFPIEQESYKTQVRDFTKLTFLPETTYIPKISEDDPLKTIQDKKSMDVELKLKKTGRGRKGQASRIWSLLEAGERIGVLFIRGDIKEVVVRGFPLPPDRIFRYSSLGALASSLKNRLMGKTLADYVDTVDVREVTTSDGEVIGSFKIIVKKNLAIEQDSRKILSRDFSQQTIDVIMSAEDDLLKPIKTIRDKRYEYLDSISQAQKSFGYGKRPKRQTALQTIEHSRVEAMEVEFNTELNKVIKEKIDEVIEFGKHFNPSMLESYLVKNFGE